MLDRPKEAPVLLRHSFSISSLAAFRVSGGAPVRCTRLLDGAAALRADTCPKLIVGPPTVSPSCEFARVLAAKGLPVLQGPLNYYFGESSRGAKVFYAARPMS